MILTVEQHASSKYAPRTYANARGADLTLAFALDFETAGEKCTKKAAGEKYLCAPLWDEQAFVADALTDLRRDFTPNVVLNIAGNGMHTLARHFWTQERANQWVYDVLKVMNERAPIATIMTGGQTGVDLAGAVAGVALQIPTIVLMPKGFVQRDARGHDEPHTQKEIEAQIADGVWRLS